VFDAVLAQGPFVFYPADTLLAEGDGPDHGARRVGCVDVRVEALDAAVPATSIPLAFQFGNRCAHPVRIAPQNATVVATWPSGATASLSLFDPEGHLHAPVLDARSRGTELLQFDAPKSAPLGTTQSICVDVSTVTGGDSSERPAPICLTRRRTFANVETIVGHGHFAEESWQRPGWHALLELGFAAHYVDLHGVTLSGTTSAGQSFSLDASRLRGVGTYSVDMRILPWLKGPFYAGGMMAAGAGPSSPNLPFFVADTPVHADVALGDFAIGAVAGVVARRSRNLRFRFDVTGGVRVLFSELYPPGCGDSKCEWDTDVVRPLIEPRAVLDAWVSPWFSMAAWLDADALYLPDFGVGLSMAFHLWAYDGVR
jgi:hypothetical protein